MNKFGLVWSRLSLGRGVLCSRGCTIKCGATCDHCHFSSVADAIIDPKKGSISANVNIVNYSLAGAYIVSYSENGFMLSNGTVIRGPMVSFPQSAFSWRVRFSIYAFQLILFRLIRQKTSTRIPCHCLEFCVLN